MKAELVATGTELLLGEITDTNSPYLAEYLSRLGIDLYWMSTVGDNLARLVETFRRAWSRSDIIISSGGLGPTPGDITRNAIASMLGEELAVEESEEQRLRQFFANRGLEMPSSNIRQATRIPSAQFLPNPSGTAPGWWVEKDGHVIITLPGPPEELRTVWENEAVPRLKQKLGAGVILSRVLKTFGIAEAKMGEDLAHLVSCPNPTVASYAKPDGVYLRVTAKAEDEKLAWKMVTVVEAKVREIVGSAIWGTDADSLPGVVGGLLRKQAMSLSVMESCTGGLLAASLTGVPGSSAYLAGGIVSYTNRAKVAFGVEESLIRDHGAVSVEVAAAMAAAVRKSFGTDLGVGITGVAGPAPLEGKKPGTVHIGIDGGATPRVISRTFPGNRQRVRERATTMALFELRSTLLGR